MKKVTVKLILLINYVQHHIQLPDVSSTVDRPITNMTEIWNLLQTEHIVIPCDVDPPSSSPANYNTSLQKYPLCSRQPPDCLQL